MRSLIKRAVMGLYVRDLIPGWVVVRLFSIFRLHGA
jgi:hypothetical protein